MQALIIGFSKTKSFSSWTSKPWFESLWKHWFYSSNSWSLVNHTFQDHGNMDFSKKIASKRCFPKRFFEEKISKPCSWKHWFFKNIAHFVFQSSWKCLVLFLKSIRNECLWFCLAIHINFTKIGWIFITQAFYQTLGGHYSPSFQIEFFSHPILAKINGHCKHC